jgi:hypothetical protein
MKINIQAILVFLIFGLEALPAEPVKWDSQYQVFPSILYRSCMEQRENFHQQIHHIRIDLRGADVSLEVAGSEEFPKNPELPSSIMKRKKAQVVVPASLFQKTQNNRNLPLGNLRTSSGGFTLGHAFPEVRLKSLNHIVFDENGDSADRTPYVKTEKGQTIRIMGINMRPQNPGFYLFTKSFHAIKKEEIQLWGIGQSYLLEQVSGSSYSNMYWVDKILEGPRDIEITREAYFLSFVGTPSQETPILDRRDRLEIIIPEEIPGQPLLGRFCGGPYFLHKGGYMKESVRMFCEKEGAPSLSLYQEPKARMALARGKNGRYMDIYCVDQKGIDFQGMTLSEFAEFLAGEGIEEAIALPDGEATSLIMGDRRINATPAGMEYPVFTALCITERPPEPGERINLLTRIPNRIIACGSGKNNSPAAVKDGSIEVTFTLDNYWEHISDDSFHKHGILIDLYKSHQVIGLELYYAEEVGFSSQFNWRSFSISTSEIDKNNLKEIMRVENPRGYSHQYIPFPRETNFRFLGIEIEKPTLYQGNQTARLAELVIWGTAE